MRFCLFSLAMMLSSSAWAVPFQLNHTGRMMDSTGLPLDGDFDLHLAIYDVETGGAQIWSEDHLLEPFDNGYFSVAIGQANTLDSAMMDGSERWLELSIDSSSPLPRQLIRSVPYAYLADVATLAGSVDGGVVNASELQIDGTTVIDSSGTFVGTSGGTLAGLSCSGAGQVPVFNGGSWTCDAPAFSDLSGLPAGLTDGDDDTTYTAGSGISLNSGTFSVAVGGVVAAMIGINAVGTSELIDGGVAEIDIKDGAITARKTSFSPDLPVGNSLLGTWALSQNSVFFAANDVYTADPTHYALRQNTLAATAPGRTILNSPEEIHFRIADANVGRITTAGALIWSGGDLKVSAGSLDLGNNTAVNLADPTNAQDAATKAYVDAAIATAVDNRLWWAAVSIDDVNGTPEYIDKDGNSETLQVPSAGGETFCSSGGTVCVHEPASADHFVISFLIPDKVSTAGPSMGSLQCWATASGDNEPGFRSIPFINAVERYATDINGGHSHCNVNNATTQAVNDPRTHCLALETSGTFKASHTTYGVVCVQ